MSAEKPANWTEVTDRDGDSVTVYPPFFREGPYAAIVVAGTGAYAATVGPTVRDCNVLAEALTRAVMARGVDCPTRAATGVRYREECSGAGAPPEPDGGRS